MLRQARAERLLIVESDIGVAALIRRGLLGDGLVGDVVTTGADALRVTRPSEYKAIVVSETLRDRSGVDVCNELRNRGVWQPMLVTTEADADGRQACAADVFLPRPFSLNDLWLALHGLLDIGSHPSLPLRAGRLTLDPLTRAVTRERAEIHLSDQQFAVLQALMRFRGRVATRDQLIEHAWVYGKNVQPNLVALNVYQLRRAIDEPFGLESIETVHRVGYRMRPDGGRLIAANAMPDRTPAASRQQ